MCVCMLYERGKIIIYKSSTTSKEALDFESSNQLNKAGRMFTNIVWISKQLTYLAIKKNLPIFIHYKPTFSKVRLHSQKYLVTTLIQMCFHTALFPL